MTRTDDPVPDACAVGDCSLREAVVAANVNGGRPHSAAGGHVTLSRAGAAEDLAATGDLIDTTISDNTALGTGVADGDEAIYANNDAAVSIERSTISGR